MDKNIIEKLKIILGLVEEEKEEKEEVVEDTTPVEDTTVQEDEVIVDDNAEEEKEEIKAMTEEEIQIIIDQVSAKFEDRIKAIEDALLIVGENQKETTEELKRQVAELSAQPGGVPVRTPKYNLPSDNENALVRMAKNKSKK